MTRRALMLTTLLAALARPAAAAMEESPRPVHDVLEKFQRLAPQGDWLGYHPRFAPTTVNPTPLVNSAWHYQGIARSGQVGGPPILYVTRSTGEDLPGETGTLQVIRMGSRNPTGERLRSNRLLGGAQTLSTVAPDEDEVVRVIGFDYAHPGGMQLCGDVLAVPLEKPDPDVPGLPRSRIAFLDCSQPDDPRTLPMSLDFSGHDAGVAGLTRLPDGHFLLLVSWGDGEDVLLFRSTATSFLDPGFGFVLHDHLTFADLIASGSWRTGKTTPQTLNLLVQDDGRVFLMGSSNANEMAPFLSGDDGLYLWELLGWQAGADAELRAVAQRAIELSSTGDAILGDPIFGMQEANFNAGGGAYVTPTGELIYYAVEYYNEGPGRATRFAEIRRVDVSSSGTCGAQLRPNHLGGPYRVPEGTSVRIEGGVTFVEPWATFFSEPGFGGRMLTLDALDQDFDDFADFEELDGPLDFDPGWSDDAESVMFCAEPGTELWLFNDDSWSIGSDTRRAPGTGRVVEWPDLGPLDDALTSARFQRSTGVPFPAPWAPAPRSYSWDLDGDGVFESAGVDGGHAAMVTAGAPGTVTRVSMRIAGVTATTTVESIDVPALVTIAPIADAVEGGVVSLSAHWSDATPAPRTITIQWGDGTTTALAAGAVTGGPIAADHVYADDRDYTVRTCVSDVSGPSCATATVRVANAAPVVPAWTASPRAEGAVLSLPVTTFTDAGTADVHQATIDWGDGTPVSAVSVTETPAGPPGSTTPMSGTLAASHVYADDATYRALLCVTDDDGGRACEPFFVVVFNSPAILSPRPAQSVPEGTLVLLDGWAFRDGGTLDTHVATVSWGDGTPVEDVPVAETPYGPPGSTAGLTGRLSGSHAYADDGAYTAEACVTDDDGARHCRSWIVTVTNAPPAYPTPPDALAWEGLYVNVPFGPFHDPGTRDTHVATVDWGDGSVENVVVFESPFGPPGSPAGLDGRLFGMHVYADDGRYAITTCVTDDDGGRGCATWHVQVRNRAPVAPPLPDRTSVEGETVSLAALFRDGGSLDTHVGFIAWGDELPTAPGTVIESPTGPPGVLDGQQVTLQGSHAYGDDGTYTVRACLLDDDGATGCGTFQVVVRNVAPTVDVDLSGLVTFPGGSALVARQGVASTWTAGGTDPGSDDLRFGWRATDSAGGADFTSDLVACNDPTGARCPDPPQSSQSHHFPMAAPGMSATHAFDAPGMRSLGLVVADDDGGSAAAGAIVLVTGDAACGHGPGGWKRALESPAIDGLLEVVAFASPSFPELRCADATSSSCLRDAARAALDGDGLDDGRRSRAWRAAVGAWLDFASGAVGWEQEIRPTGLRFWEIAQRLESVLADAGATDDELHDAERLALAVNESVTGQGRCRD